MTTRRALDLAVAALGDCSRAADISHPHLAAEVREARDFLIGVRDRTNPGSTDQTLLINEEIHPNITRQIAPPQQPGSRNVALP